MIVRCRFAHFRPELRWNDSVPLAFLADLPSGLEIVGLPASHFEHLDAERRAVAGMLIEILTGHPSFTDPHRACNCMVRYGATFPTRADRARETLALYRRSG